MAEKKIPSPEEIRMLPRDQRMKYEIAEELGYMEKVRASGWKSLTSKESGQIGGIMNHRRKKEQKCEI